MINFSKIYQTYSKKIIQLEDELFKEEYIYKKIDKCIKKIYLLIYVVSLMLSRHFSITRIKKIFNLNSDLESKKLHALRQKESKKCNKNGFIDEIYKIEKYNGGFS